MFGVTIGCLILLGLFFWLWGLGDFIDSGFDFEDYHSRFRIVRIGWFLLGGLAVFVVMGSIIGDAILN